MPKRSTDETKTHLDFLISRHGGFPSRSRNYERKAEGEKEMWTQLVVLNHPVK